MAPTREMTVNFCTTAARLEADDTERITFG